VNDILTRAVIEVRKSAFDFDSKDEKVLNWSTLQFWTILKKLASCETVRPIIQLFSGNNSDRVYEERPLNTNPICFLSSI